MNHLEEFINAKFDFIGTSVIFQTPLNDKGIKLEDGHWMRIV